MDAARRRIHVVDHLIDGGVAVRRDQRTVAARRFESVDRAGICEWGRVSSLGQHARACLVAGRAEQVRVNRATSLAARIADPRFAEQQIGDQPEERHHDDDNYPRQPRGRLPVRPEDGPHQHRDFGDEQISPAMNLCSGSITNCDAHPPLASSDRPVVTSGRHQLSGDSSTARACCRRPATLRHRDQRRSRRIAPAADNRGRR